MSKQRVPFKRVFQQAQTQLRTKFGMEMVELPVKEKITMKDKRCKLLLVARCVDANVLSAAQKVKGNSKPPSSYILTTTLPAEFRTPEIMPPSIIGSTQEEAAYTGLCTMVVSIITLSPGKSIPDSKLDRYLARLNANKNMPMDKTENVLKKMSIQGYITKVVDRSGDEETVDWVVGPRGKIEIGNRGVLGLVKEVYGESAPEDLQQRLTRSLGIVRAEDLMDRDDDGQDEEEESPDVNGGPSTQRRQSGRVR
jgi:melanoma-associated antigen